MPYSSSTEAQGINIRVNPQVTSYGDRPLTIHSFNSCFDEETRHSDPPKSSGFPQSQTSVTSRDEQPLQHISSLRAASSHRSIWPILLHPGLDKRRLFRYGSKVYKVSREESQRNRTEGMPDAFDLVESERDRK
jgi:hypothetical protein